MAILQPNKINDVLLINNVDYYLSLEDLFIDKKKFKQTDRDPTLTQLNITKLFNIIISTR